MESDAKVRILQAATELLEEAADIDAITVRQIAERAGVGIGLVNYYYQSKDNLLGIVIGLRMEAMVQAISRETDTGLPPIEKLRKLLKDTCNMGERYDKLVLHMLKICMTNGDLQAEISLIPLLREIFGEQKDEISLRLYAVQILAPLQAALIAMDSFRIYSGYDLGREAQRNDFIDRMIDNVINPVTEMSGK